MIDQRFFYMKTKIIAYLFIPYIFQLLFFISYSNVFNGQISEEYQKDHPEELTVFFAVSVILLILCGYFLLHEFLQMIMNGKSYFFKASLWNLIDISPTAMIIAVVIVKLRVRYYSYEPPAFMQTVHSIACLLIWVRSFYFLRLFKTTSKISIIIK